MRDTVSQWAAVARRGLRENGTIPAGGQGRESQKMKNRGNEAKKWLKTKDITFLADAVYARFARNSAPIPP
jgi:hypothetical protein